VAYRDDHQGQRREREFERLQVARADVRREPGRSALRRQYQFTDPIKVLFRVRDPEATLSEVSESAIREIVGRSELDEVLVGGTRPRSPDAPRS